MPFVADEVFYDFNADEFSINRFDLGIEKDITKQINAGLFYRIESEKSGKNWNEANIIGLKFNISLK